MDILLGRYAKALVPLTAGAALVALGFALGDDTLRTLGYGAISSSPFVYAIPNGADVHQHDSEPAEADTTTLGTPVGDLD